MFWLVPRPPGHHAPQNGSPRMFRVDWIEKHLSRVKPWQVLIVWVPAIAYLIYSGLRVPGVSRGAFAGALLGGLAFWTLLEYVLHRWVFHFTPNPNSELSRDVHYLIHGVHHDWPHDPDRLVMPPVMSILLAIVLGFPIFLAVGPRFFDPFFAGLVVGYIWYDMTHYAVHHVKPRTEVGAKLRKHHYLHHFKAPEARYGVSTPLWDVVFGTLPREDRAAPVAPSPGSSAGR
jgi:sterol desaturase/sphingolipid hydroxylase (fatty acid hydroxylase superfamily)